MAKTSLIIRKTKLIFPLILFAIFSQIITSCSEKEEPFKAAYFALIDDKAGAFTKELLLSPTGETRTLTLVSNRKWEILYEKVPWLDISPTSGNNTETITITSLLNESLGEDSTYISIINNTLKVVDNFKIKRQNYLATYRGNAIITSPIDSICTDILTTDTLGIIANTKIDSVGGKISLSFVTSIPLKNSFSMILEFKDNMQTVTENNQTKFVFSAHSTFDFTPLGIAINDPTVSGLKNTVINAELTENSLTFQAIIDPDLNDLIIPNVSTVIIFKGKR
jgi:hypothetical protein